MTTCPHCAYKSRNPLAIIEHIDAMHYNKVKRSVERDRSLAGVDGKPLFVRGEFVIRAKDWVALTGVSPQVASREVVDIERDPERPGAWRVGTPATGILYAPEREFVLLEEIDNYEPDGDTWREVTRPQI